MLFVSLRDLQWRRRRFLIGVLAAGLVFALTLLMSGVSASFKTEIKHTVASFGVDAWVVPSEVSGPFTSSQVFPAAEARKVASQPNVHGADPVLLMRSSITTKSVRDLNLVGIPPGGIVRPTLTSGRALRAPGDIVADASLGLRLGSAVRMFGRGFTVVGRTSGVTYFAGTPVAFVPLADLQAAALSGAPLANAVVVHGSITSAPAGYRLLTNAAVRADLGRPMRKATQTINFVMTLLWIVAAGIIGSILYLQAIERSRDFAVFKATGVTTRTLLWGLAVQAIALALCSALAAYVLSLLLTPAMSMAVEIPRSAYLALPVIAIVVGLVSSLVALAPGRHRRSRPGVRRMTMTVAADLQVRDLVIEYSSGGYPVRPIDRLSLDAGGGELVLLLGASGCGKTTLLSVLAAILTPTSGSVSVAGTDVTALRGASLTDYRRKTVGVVFQAFNLVPSLTALENVMVPLRAAGDGGASAARDRAVELLERVDLGHRLQHRPSGLSGGQQQRVAIARGSRTTRP